MSTESRATVCSRRAAAARGAQSRRTPPHSQRGIALLVAILLVALGTIIAAAVAYQNAMTARRGTATFAFDQALLIGEGAEALAAYGLRQISQQDPTHTYAAQGWAKPLGPFEVVPGVTLQASLEDLQGRFNLNNLVNSSGQPDPLQVAAFNHLLELLGLDTKWTGYLVDWIDADLVASNPTGAEDNFYTGLNPPYRTPNRYITSITELLALPKFGRDNYLKIAPYVTALPAGDQSKLNVCTARGVVLDAYLGHQEFSAQGGADSDQLVQDRANAPGCFPTRTDYAAAFDDPKLAAQVGQHIQETSSYFRLTSFITIGSTEFNLYSLLYRDNTFALHPILRSFTPD